MILFELVTGKYALLFTFCLILYLFSIEIQLTKALKAFCFHSNDNKTKITLGSIEPSKNNQLIFKSRTPTLTLILLSEK